MNNFEKKDRSNASYLLFIGIPAIILLILLRFGIYFLKSDGFSGLSVLLPLLLLGFLLTALCTSTFFAAWVYQDCKRRGEDPVLWAVIVWIATPFLGLLMYFLRRSELKQNCPACGHRISLRAKYCEECGVQLEKNHKEDNRMEKRRTHHLGYIAAGAFSMALMLICLAGFIVSAAAGSHMNTDISSNERVWNLGSISMNYNTYLDGVWKLNFKSASDGFVAQEDMNIVNAGEESLYADISCGSAPDGSRLTLWLVQGDLSQSVDVTNLSEPLVYSLSEFENGELHVRLLIEGVEDTVCEIYIAPSSPQGR